MGEITQTALLILLFVCTALNVAAAIGLAKMSLPMRMRHWAARIDTTVDDALARLGKIEKEAALWDSTLSGLIEQNEDAFGRAERKRSSAAAKLSRLEKTDLAVPSRPPTRAEIIAQLRAGAAAGGN